VKGFIVSVIIFIPLDGQRTKNNRFLYKLIPPRPTFLQDMTEFERKVMQEHSTYCKGLIDDGIAIVFALVFDARGSWGAGIIDVANGNVYGNAKNRATKLFNYFSDI
jgi:hypothetical protein